MPQGDLRRFGMDAAVIFSDILVPVAAMGAAVTFEDKIGPVLNGLEGRKSGTVAEYNYSEANKKAEIVWGDATFKDYIQNPMAKVPGTKMAFAGIKNDKEIADLWGYLAQFKADGSKK